ncbi:MAG: alcohol dehydrogenase catalytic domain-containing protein [Planctomycetes bacterium]|nr:alcohol dehydrogenase catalytic domain-containing protein [Planctomycetota bacterium]MCB9903993.1 alcohol dehydrogenase catalytic domain-containing protein [Planctomycetota bacterium]
MRGLHLADGVCSLRDDLDAPITNPGETRVRVRLAGVCATDLALQAGYMEFRGVPGHEFVGTALDGPLAGRRVVGEINAGCGECELCRAGDPRHCARRSVLGILGRPGAFAEELSLPSANLLPVPDAVSDDLAVFTEPLAAAFQVLDGLDLSGVRQALVVGDGRLGLLCAQVLLDAGLNVDLAGRHPERIELFERRPSFLRGAFEHDATPPHERWDLIVEATGRPEVLPVVLEAIRPRGTIILKTTAATAATLDLAPLVIKEARLVGSRCGRFAPAIAALADGRIRPEALIDARYPLERGPDALAHAARPGVLKVLIEMTSSETDR